MKDQFLKTRVEPALLAGFWALSERHDVSPSVLLRQIVYQVLDNAGIAVTDYEVSSERTNDHAQWARRRNAESDRGTEPVIKVRVSEGMKNGFTRYAGSQGKTASVVLHRLIAHVVNSAKIDLSQVKVPQAPEPRSERITVRFSKSEIALIKAMATPFGGVRQWLVGIVRARIAPNVPQFTTREVQGLYESNRELWALGRNVNQIAHAVNADMLQAGRLQGSAALIKELEGVKAKIDAHTQRVTALCNESLNRWTES